MKKAEIIETYNSLTTTVQDLCEIYKEKTGVVYPCKSGNMECYCKDYSKWSLETELNNRQMTISNLRHEIAVFDQIAEMKSSEEGKEFLEMLESRKTDIQKRIKYVSDEVKSSFNLILHACGLYDWEMCSNVFPVFDHNYIEMHNTKVKGSEIRGEISRRDGKWVMKLCPTTRGYEDISSRGDQYQWFKGYVTICDNYEFFVNWMNTKFHKFASDEYDLNEELRKVEETLKNPYDSYMKWKEGR